MLPPHPQHARRRTVRTGDVPRARRRGAAAAPEGRRGITGPARGSRSRGRRVAGERAARPCRTPTRPGGRGRPHRRCPPGRARAAHHTTFDTHNNRMCSASPLATLRDGRHRGGVTNHPDATACTDRPVLRVARAPHVAHALHTRYVPWPGGRSAAPDPAHAPARADRGGAIGQEDGTACAYRADVTAQGPVNGTTVAVLLGRHEAPSRRLVLCWLREQARRIADGLDPDPAVHWAGDGTLVHLPGQPADVPTELRRWCEDGERQEAASARLAEGLSFRLTTADHTGTYALRAWPVGVTSPRPGRPPLTYVRWPHQPPPWAPGPRSGTPGPRRGAGTPSLLR